MSAIRHSALVLAAACGLLATTLVGCIDDESNALPILPRFDGGRDAAPAPADAARPDTGLPPSDAGPTADGAVKVVGGGVGPGGVVSRSESFTLITKSGGTPGDGRPGASETYRLFSGLTAATKP